MFGFATMRSTLESLRSSSKKRLAFLDGEASSSKKQRIEVPTRAPVSTLGSSSTEPVDIDDKLEVVITIPLRFAPLASLDLG